MTVYVSGSVNDDLGDVRDEVATLGLPLACAPTLARIAA
jgi:hypothetical protein